MHTPRQARPVACLVAAAALVLLPACGDDPASSAADADPTRPDADPTRPDADPNAPDAGPTVVGPLPPANAPVDYQLGGAYSPPAGVMIVSRDRTAAPAAGLYNICYVNGFQIQPDEEALWLADHPDLILRDGQGNPVIDVDWNEMLIDVGTPAKREAVAAIVGDWIRGCVGAGYDAVEIDNLDSFSRSGGRLAEADAVAAMRLFADAAHAAGVPIAQKNSAEIVGRRAELGTDFVVAEECNRYGECDVYTGAYGDAVIVIEYRRADFTVGCRDFPQLSIVLRDLDLVPAGAGGYVFEGC
ncbi:MAG: endo alpha-1,4 polygalactosaminidase [Kofleriaceae bacterium]|nr:endo alpha-1,4 polygalactosaminidase [Kofleriaceae bacterium]